MKVSELIEKLQEMPQDVLVQLTIYIPEEVLPECVSCRDFYLHWDKNDKPERVGFFGRFERGL